MSQLASSLQLSGGAGSGGSQGDTELQRHFEEVQAQLVKTHNEREKDLLDALDSMQERQVALRTHVKALALGYRNLRYQVEDAVARGDAALPVKVVHENQLLGEAPNNVLANDEVSLRGIHMHQCTQNCMLNGTRSYITNAGACHEHHKHHLELAAMCVQDAERRMVTKLRHVNMPPGAEQMRGGVRGMDAQQSAAAAREESSLRRENERLRAELDGVQRLLYEGGSTKDLVQLQLEKARIAAERNTERNSAIDLGASHNSSSCAIAEIVFIRS